MLRNEDERNKRTRSTLESWQILWGEMFAVGALSVKTVHTQRLGRPFYLRNHQFHYKTEQYQPTSALLERIWLYTELIFSVSSKISVMIDLSNPQLASFLRALEFHSINCRVDALRIIDAIEKNIARTKKPFTPTNVSRIALEISGFISNLLNSEQHADLLFLCKLRNEELNDETGQSTNYLEPGPRQKLLNHIVSRCQKADLAELSSTVLIKMLLSWYRYEASLWNRTSSLQQASVEPTLANLLGPDSFDEFFFDEHEIAKIRKRSKSLNTILITEIIHAH